MKTEAIIFTAPNQVELGEIELPEPTPRDIVVEVETSGVSVGTERWAFVGKRPELAFPNIPGYIGIGRITEAGAQAQERGFKQGERVNFFNSRFVGDYGKNSWMGAHLRHAVVDVGDGVANPNVLDVHRCELVPEGLDAAPASLANLGAVAMRGIEMAGIPMDAKVLVVGLGVIGQAAAQACRLKGARVAVADLVDLRLKIAAQNGADWVIHSKNEDLAARAREIAPLGFDIIIDTSSSISLVNSLFPLLRLRGKFVFQGWYPPPSPLNLDWAHGRLPTCFFPCAHSGPAVRAMMQWARDGHINLESLITHRAAPKEAPEIYRQIAAGSDGFLGVIFDWRKS